MRASIIALAAVAAVALPATALAQYGADPRSVQAQENLRQYQQNAPAVSEAERRLNDLDQRVRTQQNLEAITPPAGPAYAPVAQLPQGSTNAAIPANVIDLDAQRALAERELSAENNRLRAYNKP
jgi:hypothetical protein